MVQDLNITPKLGHSYVPLYVPASTLGFTVTLVEDEVTKSVIPGVFKLTLYHYTWQDFRANRTCEDAIDAVLEELRAAYKGKLAPEFAPAVFNPATQVIIDYPNTEQEAPLRKSEFVFKRQRTGEFEAWAFENYKMQLVESLALNTAMQRAQLKGEKTYILASQATLNPT